MIIVKVENGKIDRALKKYKQKCKETNLVKEIRERREFRKKSARKRTQLLKAKYIQKKNIQQES